jgi:hypothetical protein
MLTAADDLAALIRGRVPLWTEERPEPGLWRFTDGDPGSGGRFVLVDGRERELTCPLAPGRYGPTVAGMAKGVSVHVDLPTLIDRADKMNAMAALEAVGALPAPSWTDRP